MAYLKKVGSGVASAATTAANNLGDAGGFSYNPFALSEEAKKQQEIADKYKEYTRSQSLNDMWTTYENHLANPVGDWTGGTYGESLKEAMDRYNNREKFSYDLNGDALYQQYKDMYINQGRMAMQDTMGQAAAMTGGYGNSYAATAGNQAYQSSLQQLNNIVPELYNLALSEYNMEGQQLKDSYDMLNQQYNTEYGQYRDQVSDWNTTANRLSSDYYNAADLEWTQHNDNRDYNTTLANTLYNREYGEWSDKVALDFDSYKQSVAEQQARDQLAISQAQLKLQQDAAAAKEAAYSMSKDEEEKFFALLDTGRDSGKYDDVKRYIDAMRGKGMTDAQAKYWLAFIDEEESKEETPIMQRYGYFNMIN